MEHKIYTGTYKKIKKQKTLLSESYRIMYGGMSNKETFTIIPIKSMGHASLTPNIYYDINSHKIQVYDIAFDVIEVSPQYIIISDDYLGIREEYV